MKNNNAHIQDVASEHEAAGRKEKIQALQALLQSELGAGTSGKGPVVIGCCPHCSSKNFVKRGFDANGRQRYICKDCFKTFTALSGNAFSTTKLPAETWFRFIECYIDAIPLRESAKLCRVSLKTASFMKQRLASVASAQEVQLG